MTKFKIKETYLLMLIVVGLVSLGIYTTYAMFTASTTLNDVVGITTALDVGKGLTEYEVVTVGSGETKLIELNIVNSYSSSIYYGAWYQIVQGNSSDIDIGLYTEKNSNPSSGSLATNGSINLLVGVTNNGTSSITVYIGAKGSLTNELNLGNNKTLLPNGFTETLLVTSEVLEEHKVTMTETVNKEFSATGAVQNLTLNKGTYKLEVWGAQGGNYSTTYVGGKGGYSYGTLTLTDTTNLYVYVGKQGSAHSTTTGGSSAGGFNGGGSAVTVSYNGTTSYVTGGGGASDIRIGQDSLYARVIVAGGGSGSSNYSSGYYGGGTSAGYGVSGYGGTATSAGTNGLFGVGSNATPSSTNYKYASPGGGGGWYGGGSSGTNRSDSTDYRIYTGGGSGYVYTSSTASNYPSGNLLTSTYYLTNAVTVAGNTSFTSTSGGTETGHSGDGYAKIVGTGEIYAYSIPNLTWLTDLKVALGESVNLIEDTILTCENNTTTGCSITNVSITDTSILKEGTHTITYTVKGTNNKKYLFNRNVNVVSSLDLSGANSPDLVQGLIPVMYDGSKWVKADSSNSNSTYQWYDYDNKLWANAVLVTDTNRSTYQNASIGTTVTESDILAFYVWIPRYKYKVWNINKVIGTDSYNAQTTGIDIVFENEKTSSGTINCTYSYATPSSSAGSPNETCTGSNGDYYTHPAFKFGSDNVRGFWIGKFELTGSSSKLTILPNVSSLRSQTISSFNTMIQNMQISGNIYGLNTSRTNTDSHMLTNYEWGAVAYLSNSNYGRCTNGSCTEVTINNCSSYITGIGADTVSASGSSSTCTTVANKYNGEKGVLASTTGNITGVYDTSGGAVEYVMGNMSSASGSYTFYPSSSSFASSWYTTSTAKYVATYAYDSSNNANQTAYNKGRLGDATGEVVLSTGGLGSWYSDYAHFPYSSYPWFFRSGSYSDSTYAGTFLFETYGGDSYSGASSRVALISLST